MSLEARFWAKVIKGAQPADCWAWRGAAKETGYGVIGAGARGQGLVRAHRLSWTLHNGPIPVGTGVLHRCDNPPCCNPAHLFLGTQTANMQDAARKGRIILPAVQGANNPSAKLSVVDVAEIRRLCKEGVAQRVVAAMYGVTQANISEIKRERTWK